MRTTLTRAAFAAAGCGALVALAVPAAASAAPTPLTGTYKWENTTSLGCIKDEGLGATYVVTGNCSIASNFTRPTSVVYGDVRYYEYEDGSGYCLTVSAMAVKAGDCAGAATQLFADPAPSSDSLYDVENGTGDLVTDGAEGLVIDYPAGEPAQGWKLVSS